MSQEIMLICITGASLGFFHTLAGPDHYLPFIAMAKARNWSTVKTAWVTLLSGLGHVLSSVVIGSVGIALGLAVEKVQSLEAVRGNIAAWLLITFGTVYMIWGIRRAMSNKTHAHKHFHANGTMHVHDHNHHAAEHVHPHEEKSNITIWVLFTIFVFGPCEPLIPILMYPAARHSLTGMATVTAVFAAATIGTMMVIVLAARRGLEVLPMAWLERFTHAVAGASIALCGMAIVFLGL